MVARETPARCATSATLKAAPIFSNSRTAVETLAARCLGSCGLAPLVRVGTTILETTPFTKQSVPGAGREGQEKAGGCVASRVNKSHASMKLGRARSSINKPLYDIVADSLLSIYGR